MKDQKAIINRQLNAIYAGLASELASDKGEGPRMIARSAQYIGMISGLTAAGYSVLITTNGQHYVYGIGNEGENRK